MTRPGEHLYLGDDRGTLELANDWATQVEACAHHGQPLPVSAWAISLAPPSIRDITAEFTTAVRRSRPDQHEADETFMLHAGFRRTA